MVHSKPVSYWPFDATSSTFTLKLYVLSMQLQGTLTEGEGLV